MDHYTADLLQASAQLEALVATENNRIKAFAHEIVENQSDQAAISLLREISNIAQSGLHSPSAKKAAVLLKDCLVKYYGHLRILEICAPKENNPEDTKTLEELLQELDALVGLTKVKDKVHDLIIYQKVQKMRHTYNLHTAKSTLHMAFTGNPGTGKTTVARIVGRIYKQLGLLSKGQFLEVSRTDLIAGYQGQTALKVKKVIEQAKGGVLFIDEAYSITENDHADSYGRECLTELTKALENYRDDLVVIVAGYTEPMMNFFESNPGLRSRFNTFIEFDDYSADELEHILESICQKNDYQLDHALKEKLILYFSDKVAAKDKNFANGRLARNIYDDLVMNHARRVVSSSHPNRQELSLLIAEDFQPVSSLSDKETPASAAT